MIRWLWRLLTGKPVRDNPKERSLRQHGQRVAAVAHARAAEIRGDRLRADYRRADEAMRR